jgi:hypothetical protein
MSQPCARSDGWKLGLFPGAFLSTLGVMAKQVLGRNLEALLDGDAKKAGTEKS